MEINIGTKIFVEGLHAVEPASSTITTTPILQNVMIEAFGDKLKLTCNNLEIVIEHEITKELEIVNEGGILIPVKLLLSYVSLLGDDDDTINLKVSNNSIRIKSEKGDFTIKGFDCKDYPKNNPNISYLNTFSIEKKVLIDGLQKTLFSSAEGNIRPNLAGIYVNIDSENNIIFASTDSFRLTENIASILLEIDNNLENFSGKIIPARTSNIVTSLLQKTKSDINNIGVYISNEGVKFILGNTVLYSRILNGNFPEYSGFFPKDEDITAEVIVNKNELIQGIKKINLISKVDNFSSVLTIKNGVIELKTNETELGNCNVILNGESSGNLSIGFNSEYLLEAIGVIRESDYIKISLSGELRPIYVRGEKLETFKHIIMPLKIN